MAVFRRRSAFGWGPPGGTKPFPPNFVFGFMTPGRTIASSAYLPGVKQRRALGSNRIPFWHVLNYSLASLQALDNNALPSNDFVLLAIVGTSSQGPNSFQTQFYQVNAPGGAGLKLSRVPVTDSNIVGSAQAPAIQKRPWPM